MFGSYAREDAHTASDIDILVDFIAPTFDNYMNFKFYDDMIDAVTAIQTYTTGYDYQTFVNDRKTVDKE